MLGTDFQKNMNQSTSIRIFNACETEKGYYFEYNCYFDWVSGTETVSGGDTLYIYNYSGEFVKEISLKKIYNEQSGVSECSFLWVENGGAYILADFSNVVLNGNTTLKYAIYTVDIESGSIEKTGWSIGN